MGVSLGGASLMEWGANQVVRVSLREVKVCLRE